MRVGVPGRKIVRGGRSLLGQAGWGCMLFGAAAAFHEVHLDRSRVIYYTLAVMGYGLLAQTSISSFSSRYRCRTAAPLRI